MCLPWPQHVRRRFHDPFFYAPVTVEGLASNFRNRRSGVPKNNPWPSAAPAPLTPGELHISLANIAAVHPTVLSSSLFSPPLPHINHYRTRHFSPSLAKTFSGYVGTELDVIPLQQFAFDPGPPEGRAQAIDCWFGVKKHTIVSAIAFCVIYKKSPQNQNTVATSSLSQGSFSIGFPIEPWFGRDSPL